MTEPFEVRMPKIDLTKLDPTKDYRTDDPIWQSVNNYLNTFPTIKEFTFLSRLTDTFLFVADLLGALRVSRLSIVRHKMEGRRTWTRRSASTRSGS